GRRRTDSVATGLSITLGLNVSTVIFHGGTRDDPVLEPTETFTLPLLPSDGSPNSDYVLGTNTADAIAIIDNDAPPPNAPPCSCGSGSPVGSGPGMAPGAPGAGNPTGGNSPAATLSS